MLLLLSSVSVVASTTGLLTAAGDSWLRTCCLSIVTDIIRAHIHKAPKVNKRAQRALGRSPEEKVKGHSGANNREPQGHNLNNFGRGPRDDAIYQI